MVRKGREGSNPSPGAILNLLFSARLVLLNVLVYDGVEDYDVYLVAVDELQPVEDWFVAPRPPAWGAVAWTTVIRWPWLI